jgi:hypothetical protein
MLRLRRRQMRWLELDSDPAIRTMQNSMLLSEIRLLCGDQKQY